MAKVEVIWKVEDRIIANVGVAVKDERITMEKKDAQRFVNSGLAEFPKSVKFKGGTGQ